MGAAILTWRDLRPESVSAADRPHQLEFQQPLSSPQTHQRRNLKRKLLWAVDRESAEETLIDFIRVSWI
jgi:hypothetical protein